MSRTFLALSKEGGTIMARKKRRLDKRQGDLSDGARWRSSGGAGGAVGLLGLAAVVVEALPRLVCGE